MYYFLFIDLEDDVAKTESKIFLRKTETPSFFFFMYSLCPRATSVDFFTLVPEL